MSIDLTPDIGEGALPLSRVRVGIVEDLDIDFLGVASLLREAGIEVSERSVSVEALSEPSSFDVVLCDLSLQEVQPKTAGLEGAEAIEHLVMKQGARVVALSRYMTPKIIADCVGAGALSYISKDRPTVPLLNSAIRRAAAGKPYLTRALASALIQDSADRPCGNSNDYDFDQRSRNLLLDVFDNGDETDLERPGWLIREIEENLEKIWRVTSRRVAVFRLHLTKRQMRVLYFYNAKGENVERIANREIYSESTIRSEMNSIAEKYNSAHGTDLKPSDACRVVWAGLL